MGVLEFVGSSSLVCFPLMNSLFSSNLEYGLQVGTVVVLAPILKSNKLASVLTDNSSFCLQYKSVATTVSHVFEQLYSSEFLFSLQRLFNLSSKHESSNSLSFVLFSSSSARGFSVMNTLETSSSTTPRRIPSILKLCSDCSVEFAGIVVGNEVDIIDCPAVLDKDLVQGVKGLSFLAFRF